MMSDLAPDVRVELHDRLRRPASASTVPGPLTVLFFGDLLTAEIATVSLNPSRREYTNNRGEELEGAERRFETLNSLQASARASMSDEQCDRAIATMRGYFDPDKPAYSWFASLSRVVQGMGYDYQRREVAHLDLVQEATDPTWSKLLSEKPSEGRSLLESDAPFLQWQIERFPLKALFCNGRTAFDQVVNLTHSHVVVSETRARLRWTIAVGSISERRIAVVGWNIPLARPTGLTAQDHVAMGQLFKHHLEALGIETS